MKLRERIVFTLLTISVLLAAPSVYGLFALRGLQQVAHNLRTRDAVGSLALGRLQAALSNVEYSEQILVAVSLARGTPPQREAARQQVERSSAEVERQLAMLASAGYRDATAAASAQWQRLEAVIRQEQEWVEAGAADAAEAYRVEVVNPAFSAMDATLTPIGEAINRVGEAQVQLAQQIAARAATTTLLALAIAVAVALGIGIWLTRSLLRPIGELRQGMAVVAEGDFDPDLHVPPDRPDELGDLSRSFRTMTQQLAELDRLKAEFVSIASHELKTPLSVIKGYVTLLRDGIYGPVPEQQQKILTSVADQTDRLARLVQQLLDISRLEAGGGRLELRPLDLQQFLGELATSFEVLAYQNEIDFKVDVADNLPETVVGDADRLNEVVGNLLSNAFKFTPRGGQIRLRAESRDSSVVVEVADSGVGIPAEHLPRIFEKFYQVENEAQPKSVGSGLGLAIAREIVEAHGGTIAAESRVGRGTTFRVSLPESPVAPTSGHVPITETQ